MITINVSSVARPLGAKRPSASVKVPEIGVSAAQVRASIATLHDRIGPPRGHPGLMEAPLRPRAGVIYAAFSLLCAAAAVLAVFVIKDLDWLGIALAPALAGCFYLALRAVVCFRPTAEKLVAHDGRRPVIYLRSFRDDDAMVRIPWRASFNIFRTMWFEYTRSGLYSLLFHRMWIRLEQAVEDELSALGPFIAIGEPNERRPDFGAARAYFEGDDTRWREAVAQWMERALLVVIVPGPTRGLAWEIGQVFERGQEGKLVLMMPPEKRASREARLSALAKMLPSDDWRQAVSTPVKGELVAVFRSQGGEMVRCVADRARQLEVEASVLIAQYLTLCPSPNVESQA